MKPRYVPDKPSRRAIGFALREVMHPVGQPKENNLLQKELSMSENPRQPMPVALLEWRPMKRNSLRGFATVRVGAALKMSDIPVHCSSGKRWASLPSKPLIDASGMAQKDDRGKIKYVPIIQWTDKDSADRFSEGVVLAIEAQYPGDTQGD